MSPKGPMTDEHREKLAVGRRQSNVVRRYLDALEANKPKRGRKRTAATIEKRIREIDDQMDDLDPLKRLLHTQERMDLEKELEAKKASTDIGDLEKQFVKIAKDYSERKEVSYQAWRAVGVPAEVLRRAGITRSSS